MWHYFHTKTIELEADSVSMNNRNQWQYWKAVALSYLRSQLLATKELFSFIVVEVKCHLFWIFYQKDISVFDLIRMKLLPVSLYLQSTNLYAPSGRNEDVHSNNHEVTALTRFVPLVDSHVKIIPLQTASIDNLLPEKGWIILDYTHSTRGRQCNNNQYYSTPYFTQRRGLALKDMTCVWVASCGNGQGVLKIKTN